MVLILAPSSPHNLSSFVDRAIAVSFALRPTTKSISYSLPFFDTRVTSKKLHSCKSLACSMAHAATSWFSISTTLTSPDIRPSFALRFGTASFASSREGNMRVEIFRPCAMSAFTSASALNTTSSSSFGTTIIAVLLEPLCSTFLTISVWPSNFCSEPIRACSAVWASRSCIPSSRAQFSYKSH